MHSRDLNRAVARATGEAVREIALRGLVLLTCGPVEQEPRDDAEDADKYGLGACRGSEHGTPLPEF